MRLDKTLSGVKDMRTPVWFMRQAGRYLPEYQNLRASEADFITYCLNSDKAMQATLQPITRYGLDAAIIFSDILMIPWALGMSPKFIQGEGPKMTPLAHPADSKKMDASKLLADLAPVFDAIRLTRKNLPADTNLIGFCGAPWTVATYMLEGGSSRDFERTRHWLWSDSAAMAILLNRLADLSVDYLAAQARAGADCLMVFDSWAGAVPAYFLDSVVIQPMCRIVTGLRKSGITTPIIGFPKGIGEGIIDYADQVPLEAIGLDHTINPYWADRNLPPNLAVQGNLDPIALLSGGSRMKRAVDSILGGFATRPHIFNLGHGINQHTPTHHVAKLIEYIRKTAR